MKANHSHHASVAIVGGGPVGMMLALFLDQYDVPVVLFNSEANTRWHPKGNTHNSRTMEHYRRLGLAGAMRRLGLPQDYPRDVVYFTRLTGWELARLAMPTEQERMLHAEQASATDQVPEPLLRANQMYVERYLLEHIRTRKNIRLRYGWRVTGLEQDDSGVELSAAEVANPEMTEDWRADYLVGCDGGQSFVRRSLGIGYAGPDGTNTGFLSGRMFSSHVRIPALHRDILVGRKGWMYNVMAPDSRLLLISLNGADEFLLMTQAQSQDEMPNDASVISAIQQGIGDKLYVQVLAHAVWHGGLALVAERFSDRRVYLAGDAIHLFSPTGGFGMNTGIDGAANLAWKLAAAVQGWAGDDLLASYERERRPVTYRNTAAARLLTQRVGRVEIPAEIEEDGLSGERARRELGAALQGFLGQFTAIGVELGARYDESPIIWPDGTPPADDPLHYQPSSVPGGRLPHLWVEVQGRSRQSVFDLLGLGFTLLRIGPDAPPADSFRAAALRRGIPLHVVELESSAAREFYQVRLILVRPDQHIGWRGDAVPGDAGAVLDQLVGRGRMARAGEGRVLDSVLGAVG